MAIYKIDKKYVCRHKILEYLYLKIKFEPLHNINLLKSKSSFVEMANNLKLDAMYLRECHQGFHTFEKDHVACFNEGDNFIIGITEPGINAYLDNYWIREGHKELNERIYEKTKWSVPLIALIITVLSLLYSVNTVRDIHIKIEQLEEKYKTLDQLKKH